MTVLYIQGLAAAQQIENTAELVQTAIKKVSKIEKLVKQAWALSPAQEVVPSLLQVHICVKLTLQRLRSRIFSDTS